MGEETKTKTKREEEEAEDQEASLDEELKALLVTDTDLALNLESAAAGPYFITWPWEEAPISLTTLFEIRTGNNRGKESYLTFCPMQRDESPLPNPPWLVVMEEFTSCLGLWVVS